MAGASAADLREAFASEGRREGAAALDPGPQLREVGSLAVWTLSSAKQGFGVEQLRDDSIDTYWQSDGQQPHTVTIQFPRKMDIETLALYLDHALDESYTPSRISVRGGTGMHDLHELKVLELQDPKGWLRIPLTVRANVLQVAILQNHQNGRDSHVRLMKVFGTRPEPAHLLRQPLFTDPDLSQYSQLR